MIIYDEKKYAENLLINGPATGRHISFRDIIILGKYFRYIGIKGKKIEEKVLEFFRGKVKGFDEISYYETIRKALNVSKKKKLKISQDVPITIDEINKIRQLNNYRVEKILFYLLVIAKHSRITNVNYKESESKNYFVGNNYVEHLRMAHTSEKKGENIFHDLIARGYLGYIYKYDNLILKYSDMNDTSETFILVTNMNDIISFYPPYCCVCHKNLEKNSNSHKMCKDCWTEKRKIDVANNVKMFRNKSVIK